MWKRQIFRLIVKLTFIDRSSIPCLNTFFSPISNIPARINYKFYCTHFPRICTQFTEINEVTKMSRYCTDNENVSSNTKGKSKGKPVPLQAWSGPEGSRKLRFPDFMTTAQDGGKVSHTHRPSLPPGNTPGTHFC